MDRLEVVFQAKCLETKRSLGRVVHLHSQNHPITERFVQYCSVHSPLPSADLHLPLRPLTDLMSCLYISYSRWRVLYGMHRHQDLILIGLGFPTNTRWITCYPMPLPTAFPSYYRVPQSQDSHAVSISIHLCNPLSVFSLNSSCLEESEPQFG